MSVVTIRRGHFLNSVFVIPGICSCAVGTFLEISTLCIKFTHLLEWVYRPAFQSLFTLSKAWAADQNVNNMREHWSHNYSGAPWVSKSTHPRKFGNHLTVHRTNDRPSAPQAYQWKIVGGLWVQWEFWIHDYYHYIIVVMRSGAPVLGLAKYFILTGNMIFVTICSWSGREDIVGSSKDWESLPFGRASRVEGNMSRVSNNE